MHRNIGLGSCLWHGSLISNTLPVSLNPVCQKGPECSLPHLDRHSNSNSTVTPYPCDVYLKVWQEELDGWLLLALRVCEIIISKLHLGCHPVDNQEIRWRFQYMLTTLLIEHGPMWNSGSIWWSSLLYGKLLASAREITQARIIFQV